MPRGTIPPSILLFESRVPPALQHCRARSSLSENVLGPSLCCGVFLATLINLVVPFAVVGQVTPRSGLRRAEEAGREGRAALGGFTPASWVSS